MVFTRFKNGVKADAVLGIQTAKYLSPTGDYELKTSERAFVVAVSMGELSKTLKTALPLETSCVVVNAGANAFTLKNVTGDAGLSLPAGRAALVVVTGSSGTSVITPLYTPAT